MNPQVESQPTRWQTGLQRARGLVKRTAPFAAGVLSALLALVLYNTLFPGPAALSARDAAEIAANVMASATPVPAYSRQVYQIIQPSLVLIQTKGADVHKEEGFGLGSGVVIDDQGNILTSLHVVENATEIRVTFADGFETQAKIVAEQPENDIAVIQPLEPPTLLIPAILGNPNAMSVGDEAFAVGNPFGLYSSMSAGVISGFDRTFKIPNSSQKLEGLIQIDTAVNPGNSGGPLLNRYGHVIGIVTGLVNPTDESFFVGIGFAVPINVAASAAGSPPY